MLDVCRWGNGQLWHAELVSVNQRILSSTAVGNGFHLADRGEVGAARLVLVRRFLLDDLRSLVLALLVALQNL